MWSGRLVFVQNNQEEYRLHYIFLSIIFELQDNPVKNLQIQHIIIRYSSIKFKLKQPKYLELKSNLFKFDLSKFWIKKNILSAYLTSLYTIETNNEYQTNDEIILQQSNFPQHT